VSASDDDRDLTPEEYEELVTEIVRGLQNLEGVQTICVSRGVAIQGMATKWNLDVTWEFCDSAGRHLVFFECRYATHALKQEALIAVKGRRDDLANVADTVTAVIVTRTGFQSGALGVADFYGLIVLELRRPTPADWHGRVRQLAVNMRILVPDVADLELTWDTLSPGSNRSSVVLQELSFYQSGDPVSVVSLLYGSEGMGWDDKPRQLVEQAFHPPVDVHLANGSRLGTISALRARIGVTSLTQSSVISGEALVAYYVREALCGDEAVILSDGRIQHLSKLIDTAGDSR
jgi:hypothetical protein